MKSIILAGGSGTRLWPVSRQGFPKQFMKINGSKSLLCKSVERLLKVCKADDLCIITNEAYKLYVIEDLKNISGKLEKNLVLEPAGRNTAPAIALAMRYCMDKLKCKKDEVIFIMPSDHIIKPEDKFSDYIKTGVSIAKKGYIVTFGIKPETPATGYGYIKRGRVINSSTKGGKIYKVEKFEEKPDIGTAREYVASKEYFWNSGMFAFTINTMMEALKRYAPVIYKNMNGKYEEVIRNFKEMPDISIDYAVMEKSDKSAVLPMDITWSDIGSWDSLMDIMEKDENRNIKIGNVVAIDTRDTMILGDKRLISTIGLKDIIIVETDDAVLVTHKGHSQKVKDIVDILNKEERKEAVEHRTIYRPWGHYTILEEGPRYKIKRIVVKPRERLSLQMHHHRSEHWIVIKGMAKVKIGDEEKFIHENESTYVPKSTPHRLENPGKIGLEIIEVQNGEYVEEDDILRLEDIYGRLKNSNVE